MIPIYRIDDFIDRNFNAEGDLTWSFWRNTTDGTLHFEAWRSVYKVPLPGIANKRTVSLVVREEDLVDGYDEYLERIESAILEGLCEPRLAGVRIRRDPLRKEKRLIRNHWCYSAGPL